MKTVLLKMMFIFVTLMLSACAQKSDGTSTGNPLVAVKLKSFSTLAAKTLSAQSVSNLKMCFKRLRFKQGDGATEREYDLNIGEVAVLSSGTLLTSLQLPPGTYNRVEFDLESECSSGLSIQLTNSNGSFATDDRIEIRFEGTFNLTSNQDLELNIQSIINAMDTVTSSSQIKSRAESVSGSF